ncbi:MAG TPA: SPOR domain-containing protein [bacterium]|nr:SPOR domain-containing protein [bacterium]
MPRRGIYVIVLAICLFAVSAAVGFLMATGTLRHSPGGAAAPGGPDLAGQAPSGPAAPAVGGTPAIPVPGGSPAIPAGGVPSTVPPAGTVTVMPPPARVAPPTPAGSAAPPAGSAAGGTGAAPSGSAATGGSTAPSSETPGAPVIAGRFHVQVGAFAERQNAEALAVRIRAHGYAVTVAAGPPYRVWVGGYFDVATAERLAANLLQDGFASTLVPR